jgi:dihydroxyacid dehydratase/phosphogluconate dehydratase
MGGQWYDVNISIPGCDKNMPGCLIAMARVNRPSLMVRTLSQPSLIISRSTEELLEQELLVVVRH